MKTDQLVSSLVADRPGSARPLGRAVGRAVLAGALVSLVIFAVEFGPRETPGTSSSSIEITPS